MKPNRRNLLIGLATATVGGGAAFGSGAFSQVEADRTVSVNTAGDGSAYLKLEGDDNYVGDDSSGGALTIDLGTSNGFNKEARTVVEGIVVATNNAANGNEITVGFDDGGSQVSSTSLLLGDGNGNPVADVTLYFGTESNQTTQTIGTDGTANIGAIVETRSSELGTTPEGQDAEITILAKK